MGFPKNCPRTGEVIVDANGVITLFAGVDGIPFYTVLVCAGVFPSQAHPAPLRSGQ